MKERSEVGSAKPGRFQTKRRKKNPKVGAPGKGKATKKLRGSTRPKPTKSKKSTAAVKQPAKKKPAKKKKATK